MKAKGKFINCLCVSTMLGVAAAMMIPQAMAAHNGNLNDYIPVDLFELDENTPLDGTGVADWEDTNGAVFSGIVPDDFDRTFTKGSKDVRDITKWHWDFYNTVTPKDDIQHAYAAYLKDGDDYLYFGLDRLSGSSSGGTTSFGFWAFQDAVSLVEPLDPDSDDTFNGTHKDGDIFIAGDMSGNTIDELRVYMWSGDGASGSLVELTGANITPHCDDAPTDVDGNYLTDACGEINTAPIAPSWLGGEVIEPGRFIEVGVNYNALIGPLPCFNTFMATTRTSDSETASTKNFTLGGFPVCSIDVTKTCSTVALVDPFGNAENGYMPIYRTEFLATVINDGGAQFSSTAQVTITDAAGTVFGDGDDIVVTRTVSGLTGPSGGDGSDGFQPTEQLDVPDTGLTITGSYLTTSNGGQNSVKAKIDDGPLSVSSEVFTQNCGSLSLTPALYIEKDCDDVTLTTKDLQGGDLGQVGITVGYDIRACNTGEFALDVDLYDPTVGLNTTDVILANGVSCDTNADCPASSSCVGADSPDPGVCVYNASDVNGPDPLDPTNDTKSVAVCSRTNGDYLLTGLTGGASSATPFDAIFSNTAKVSASTADNPLLSTNIMETDTADCPLCDSDEDHVPDYTDPDPQDPNVPAQ